LGGIQFATKRREKIEKILEEGVVKKTTTIIVRSTTTIVISTRHEKRNKVVPKKESNVIKGIGGGKEEAQRSTIKILHGDGRPGADQITGVSVTVQESGTGSGQLLRPVSLGT